MPDQRSRYALVVNTAVDLSLGWGRWERERKEVNCRQLKKSIAIYSYYIASYIQDMNDLAQRRRSECCSVLHTFFTPYFNEIGIFRISSTPALNPAIHNI